MLITILTEDDCAPDAREYFIKNMKDKFNLNFNDFIKLGKTVYPDDWTIEHHYAGHILSFHAEDPFYKLEKIGDK